MTATCLKCDGLLRRRDYHAGQDLASAIDADLFPSYILSNALGSGFALASWFCLGGDERGEPLTLQLFRHDMGQ